jgi:hypothetical protein
MLLILEEPTGRITVHDATPFERLLARVHHARLDRDLAAGASPEANKLLALRARFLVCPTVRHRLASAFAAIIAEAVGPPARPGRMRVPVRRGSVLEAVDVLQALVDRLRTPGPLPARGVAQVQRILTDGSGPLYYAGSAEQLRGIAQDALKALESLSGW